MIKKILFGLSAILLTGALILALWYQIDGQPLPEADEYLDAKGYTVAQSPDGGFVFTPQTGNGYGLLIMHGALIKPKSYAKTAAFFAGQGYTVLLPNGFARLSINAVNPAAERIAAIPVTDWFVIGHSMGGFSSLTLISRHDVNVRAVALWASAMPTDFSALTMPILFLSGDHDGLLPPERLASTKAYLPETTRYVTVAGGNHQNFAMYSHQFLDEDALISWREQIDFANRKTAAFFAEYHR